MRSNRGNSGRSGRRLNNDINVVPYIDVMLVLLIIFMVTAPMITPGLINLPSMGQASEVTAKPVEVQIGEDGAIAIRIYEAGGEFQTINSQNLLSEVQSRITSDTPVVIAADGHVPYETVMKVMDQLRAGGVARLGLLVDQKASSEPLK